MVATLLPVLLLAASALAIPSSRERLDARVAARSGASRQSVPSQHLEHDVHTLVQTNNTAETYSSNWAGAKYTWPQGYITGVSGTFIVPKPTVPPGGSSGTAYSGTAWVGIDGWTCQQAILQSGVDWTVQNGQVSYGAWYEWFPAAWVNFQGISFKAGDSVTIAIKTSSSTSGTATITNNSNGQKVSQTVTASGKPALCQEDVEWIVEDYSSNGLVPFANFGTVSFTNAGASLSNGQGIGSGNADTIDLVANGQAVTQTTVSNAAITVKYV